ncbi:hypothetical protein ACWCSH_48175, partial [Streptosporangium sp. NPDC001682]
MLTLLLHARRYKPATAVTKGRTEAPVIVVDISAPQFPRWTGFRNSFNSSDRRIYADRPLLAGTDLVVQCWTGGTLTRE